MNRSTIILLLCVCILSKTTPPQKISLSGDHFFSQKNTSKTYQLKDLQENKPLFVLLKKKNEDSKTQDWENLLNPVTITIKDNKQNQQICKFTKLNHVCHFANVESKLKTTIKIQCERTPCDVTFQSLQADPIKANFSSESTPLQHYYEVGDNNTIVQLSCNDSQIDDFRSKIRMYTNTAFDVEDIGNMRTYVFTGNVDNLIFAIDKSAKQCAKILFLHSQSVAQFGKENNFYISGSKNIDFDKLPEKELRIDFFVKEFKTQSLSQFNVSFYGTKDQKRQLIQTFTIQALKQPSLYFNIILKKKKLITYTKFSMQINSTQTLLVNTHTNDDEVHTLSIQQESYMNLDENQTIVYQIERSKEDQNMQVEAFFLPPHNNQTDMKLDCEVKKSCKLTLIAKKASEVGVVVRYKRIKSSQVEYIPLTNNQIELKMKEGEVKYLQYNNTSGQNMMLFVSSPNVLVYAAGEKCPKPSAACYEFSGNLKHMINIEDFTGQLFIAVEALQIVKFTFKIRVSDEELGLNDGVPMKINMQKDKQIVFKFRIQKKEDVNFNLIASPGYFQMFVVNSEEQPDTDDIDLAVSSGYLRFAKKDIDELVFTILIKLKVDKPNQRFTIIASTKSSVVLLDRSEPHYDVIKKGEYKKYAILVAQSSIENKQETVISVDIFQKIPNLNMTLKLGSDLANLNIEKEINRNKMTFNLHEHFDLCDDQQGDDCNIYLSLENHNDLELDVTLNVLVQHSIIELHSGIWQNYEMSTLTSSTHFYFAPTTRKSPITLMFSHSFGVYRINYHLWHNKNKVINPGEWPFPDALNSTGENSGYQTSEYTIPVEEIQICYPDCILLVALEKVQKITDPNVVEPLFYGFGHYSIMATDTIIQINQQQKISISLKSDQSRFYLISLKDVLEHNKTITFFTSNMIGYHQIYARLTSNRLDLFPNDKDFDFIIAGRQKQIIPEQIREIMVNKSIDTHQQIDMILYAKCTGHCKFLLEFTTKDQYIETLHFGVPVTVKLEPNKSKLFSVDYFSDYRIKYMRKRGFPIIVSSICASDVLETCIQQLEAKQGSPMISKNIEQPHKPSNGAFNYIRIYTKDEPAEIDIVPVASQNSIQLMQGTIVTDFVSTGSTNTYRINTVPNEDTTITVTVFEGNPVVKVTDLRNNRTKEKIKKGNAIQFYISGIHQENEGGTIASVMPMPIFKNYSPLYLFNSFSQLTVQVTDNTFNCSYSIGYTLGEKHVDLTDGVLTSASLHPQEAITYNYYNKKNLSSMVTISLANATMLNDIAITVFSYSFDQQDAPVETAIEQLKSNKNTPKPSLTFELSAASRSYEIKIQNNASTENVAFMVIINHADMVYLPFDYDYPNYLKPNSSVQFIVEAENTGFVELLVKKCSDSDLTLSYSIGDEAYLNGNYSYQEAVQQTKFKVPIKIQKSQTIYVKLATIEGGLFSILSTSFEKKTASKPDLKAGAKGEVTYENLDEKTVEVYFTPAECTKNCNKIQYYLVNGIDSLQVKNEIACPGNYFMSAPMVALKQQPIKYTKVGNKYKFSLNTVEETTYLGIKAVTEDGRQVTYQVVELQSFWKILKKHKTFHIGIVGLLLICAFCLVCLICRRRLKKDYREFKDLPETENL